MVETKTTRSTSAALACWMRWRRAAVVDHLEAVVALGAAAGNADHTVRAGHRFRQRLTTANVSNELRHVRRKDLAALRRISDQGANGNVALDQAPDDQAPGPTGCSDDQDGPGTSSRPHEERSRARSLRHRCALLERLGRGSAHRASLRSSRRCASARTRRGSPAHPLSRQFLGGICRWLLPKDAYRLQRVVSGIHQEISDETRLLDESGSELLVDAMREGVERTGSPLLLPAYADVHRCSFPLLTSTLVR